MLKIQIVFRSLGNEAPNPSIEVAIEDKEFLRLQRAWDHNGLPGAIPTFALKTTAGDAMAKVLLRLDLIAYIHVYGLVA